MVCFCRELDRQVPRGISGYDSSRFSQQTHRIGLTPSRHRGGVLFLAVPNSDTAATGACFVCVICARGPQPCHGSAPARALCEGTVGFYPPKKLPVACGRSSPPSCKTPLTHGFGGGRGTCTCYRRSDSGNSAAFEHTITPVLLRFPCLPVL